MPQLKGNSSILLQDYCWRKFLTWKWAPGYYWIVAQDPGLLWCIHLSNDLLWIDCNRCCSRYDSWMQIRTSGVRSVLYENSALASNSFRKNRPPLANLKKTTRKSASKANRFWTSSLLNLAELAPYARLATSPRITCAKSSHELFLLTSLECRSELYQPWRPLSEISSRCGGEGQGPSPCAENLEEISRLNEGGYLKDCPFRHTHHYSLVLVFISELLSHLCYTFRTSQGDWRRLFRLLVKLLLSGEQPATFVW